jgi:hypothetical protein
MRPSIRTYGQPRPSARSRSNLRTEHRRNAAHSFGVSSSVSAMIRVCLFRAVTARDANLAPMTQGLCHGLMLDSDYSGRALTVRFFLTRRPRCNSFISSTASASPAPTSRRHSLTKLAKGPRSRVGPQRAVREGATPAALRHASERRVTNCRSASRLGKCRRGSGAKRIGHKTRRDRLPVVRRRPSTNWPPIRQRLARRCCECGA